MERGGISADCVNLKERFELCQPLLYRDHTDSSFLYYSTCSDRTFLHEKPAPELGSRTGNNEHNTKNYPRLDRFLWPCQALNCFYEFYYPVFFKYDFILCAYLKGIAVFVLDFQQLRHL